MSSGRVTVWLSWIVGLAFVAMGLVEIAVRVISGDPVELAAIAFWSLTLLGGGVLVLVGSFALPTRPGLSTALVVAGCFLGVLGSAWTLILPVAAIALIFLRMREGNARARTQT